LSDDAHNVRKSKGFDQFNALRLIRAYAICAFWASTENTTVASGALLTINTLTKRRENS